MIELKSYVVEVADFPRPGILFRDISRLLREHFGPTLDALDGLLSEPEWAAIDAVAGVESRGFILGAALAARRCKGFVLVRKKGKLPPPVVDASYDLEYGSAVLEMQPGRGSLLLVDDVLATGGTMTAAAQLCEHAGYQVTSLLALLDLRLGGPSAGATCGCAPRLSTDRTRHELGTASGCNGTSCRIQWSIRGGGIQVLYCGVGKVNAAIVLSRRLAEFEHSGGVRPLIVNFGSVGSHRFPTGTFVGCHQFVQRDMDVRALGFAAGQTPYEDTPSCLSFAPVFAELPAAVCGSGDSFSTSKPPIQCDVVDMEAYALAKACWLAEVPFACAKFVTDGADHVAAQHWQSNVDKAAHEFLELYRRLGTAHPSIS